MKLQIKPFIAFLIPIITYHVIMYIVGDSGDDIGIARAMQEYSFWEHLQMRYLGHSSRVAGDSLTALFVQLPYPVFLVVNLGVWISLYWILSSLIGLIEKWQQYALSFVLLIYPFCDTISAGPIATVTNYLWTLTSLCFLILIERDYRYKSFSIFLYPIVGIAIFETCLFQLTAVIFLPFLFVLYFISFGDNEWQKRTLQSKRLMVVYSLCSVLGVIIILASPATEHRLLLEVPQLNPLFFDYSIVDKVVLGLYRLSQILIGQVNLVFILLLVTIAFLGRVLFPDKYLLFSVPLIVVMLSLFAKRLHFLDFDSYYLSDGESLYQVFVPIVLLMVVFGSFVISLFKMVNEKRPFYVLIFLIVMGGATQFVMGFAPSVYYSGDRTAIFLYFALIITWLYLIKQNGKKLPLFQKRVLGSTIIIVAICTFVLTARNLIRPLFVDVQSIMEYFGV